MEVDIHSQSNRTNDRIQDKTGRGKRRKRRVRNRLVAGGRDRSAYRVRSVENGRPRPLCECGTTDDCGSTHKRRSNGRGRPFSLSCGTFSSETHKPRTSPVTNRLRAIQMLAFRLQAGNGDRCFGPAEVGTTSLGCADSRRPYVVPACLQPAPIRACATVPGFKVKAAHATFTLHEV